LTVQASDSVNEVTATVTVTTSCITGWTSPGTASGDNVDIEIAIAENSLEEGDVIFRATATALVGETITYALVSSTADVGEIDANGIDVVVAPLKTLDFETNDKYEFVVL